VYLGQKYGIFPFSPQLLSLPSYVVESIYEISKKQDLVESIYTSVISEPDICFNDIDAVILPKKMCPFGCKVKKCPYNWDITKCPHDLDKKSIDELSLYFTKSLYIKDEDVAIDKRKQFADEKTVKAILSQKTRGNYQDLVK